MPFDVFPAKPGDHPSLDEITRLRAEVERLTAELNAPYELETITGTGRNPVTRNLLSVTVYDPETKQSESFVPRAEVERLTRELGHCVALDALSEAIANGRILGRVEALEEAAKVADEYDGIQARAISDAIRAISLLDKD